MDDRGRFTIPKEIGLRGQKMLLIPAGSYLVVLPLRGDPYQYAKSWLKTEKTAEELEGSSEKMASEDAEGRHKRRAEKC